MSIRDWPDSEKPREKLLRSGAAGLGDAELLAIFLRTGVPGASAVDLARQLLSQFGGLRAVLDASLEEFSHLPGLGPTGAGQAQAAKENLGAHAAVAGDLGTEPGCEEVLEQLNGIDEVEILVNNAGIFSVEDFFAIEDDEWLRYYQTNVLSAVRLCRTRCPSPMGRYLYPDRPLSSRRGRRR